MMRERDASWKPRRDLPPKTDLLHKGHSKGGKLLVAMVGLPGRGKTYISRKVARYLRWINYRTRAFSLARYGEEAVHGSPPLVRCWFNDWSR